MPLASIDYDGKGFVISCPPFDADRARSIPQRKFDNKNRVWQAPATATNVTYINMAYESSEMTPAARKVLQRVEKEEERRRAMKFPSWLRFKNDPMQHQHEALDRAWGMGQFAFLMEMRTGKTFVVINWAAALAMTGEIDTLVVCCPTPIKEVWVDELEKHCPIDYYWHIHDSGNRDTEKIAEARYDRLKVMIFGVEAMSQGSGPRLMKQAVGRNRTFMALDESSRIKNHKSKRTQCVIDIGALARYRTIMTGTVTTQGMEDLYTQYRFLDESIIGMKSYYVFQARYCVMGGFEGRQIIGYNRTGELMERIKPYTYQVLARDVIDPPEEVYEQRIVEPTSAQKKMLKELGDPLQMATTQGDLELEVETVLERMTRYQQIVGGHFPYDKDDHTHGIEPIQGTNPKLDELLQIIEDIGPDHKMIVWARFRPEISLIVDKLVTLYGTEAVAEYHGGNTREREAQKKRFMTAPPCRFFVANQSAAGMGLELSAADTHIYYSNTFSYEDRKQSRARTDSKEQKSKNILCIDIIMRHKIDRAIVEALRNKQDIADFVKNELGANSD